MSKNGPPPATQHCADLQTSPPPLPGRGRDEPKPQVESQTDHGGGMILALAMTWLLGGLFTHE